jgi:hypothetical protein
MFLTSKNTLPCRALPSLALPYPTTPCLAKPSLIMPYLTMPRLITPNTQLITLCYFFVNVFCSFFEVEKNSLHPRCTEKKRS